ncbi:MgtE intracellular region [Beutenbergia cavernae DSM 12333]|uniref:MgtE intracellular region n=1 Tax=Beutenbergia cavernae (strain ATCC BAA-8 / DSM 12333 / CCUG 43141 / JCM 11478 / NBRC 16432 / NCIMB 13614 / HKI 0122) TaxID=471853 RepID=C5BZ43_BEUC1|nr:CBS domain-containing protein [Beutenbergia cavernae]ACQ81158.1 MgtE intracellular region [Beutenbergia cavernae DSM 12333]
MSSPTRVFVARLAGATVFDPLGDAVGRVHDVVVLIRAKGAPRAVGLVVEVPGRRRVFLPLSRVTSMEVGAVITTGLVNIRRFEQRTAETLVVAQLFDRRVTLAESEGGGEATIEDAAIEQQRNRDWLVTKLFVRRRRPGSGLRLRRGEGLVVDSGAVSGLTGRQQQGAAALLATLEDLKPADLADVLHDLPDTRRLEVASELDDDRLADVLEELGEEDRVEIVVGLHPDRAARVLDVMQPDDAADLVGELPATTAAELLERMEPEEADDVRRLLAYDEHTAGGLMTTEPLILGPEATIAAALAHARRRDVTPALAAMVFVVRPPLDTPTGRFLGVVHLQHMLREPPHDAIGTIIDSDIESLAVSDPIGKVTRLLATYNLTALPVVDGDGRLVGAVSVDDVLDHLLPDDWRDADDDVTDTAMSPRGSVTHG